MDSLRKSVCRGPLEQTLQPIFLRTISAKDHLTLTVTDITEKLASTKENGLGLGLQIVKGIAEHHRAKLDFKVRDQNGVAVSVFFPRDYGK